MARHIFEDKIDITPEALSFAVQEFSKLGGYKTVDYKGEQVLKAGNALIAAPKYFKIEYGNGVLHIECWIRSMGSEMGLDGAMGFAVKAQLRTHLNTLVRVIYEQAGATPPQI